MIAYMPSGSTVCDIYSLSLFSKTFDVEFAMLTIDQTTDVVVSSVLTTEIELTKWYW